MDMLQQLATDRAARHGRRDWTDPPLCRAFELLVRQARYHNWSRDDLLKLANLAADEAAALGPWLTECRWCHSQVSQSAMTCGSCGKPDFVDELPF
jgi:hypothetical protein